MIDLKKIHDINSKGSFKKFTKKHKIDEPLFLGNYLFHFLIMYGNLNALKFANHPIYHENDEGMAGIHLAAKIGNETKNFKILDYLLSNYKEYIYNFDHWGNNFLFWINEPSDNFLKVVKNNSDIDWLRLFTYLSSDNKLFLEKIFINGSSKFVDYVFEKYISPEIIIAKEKNDFYEFNKYNTFITHMFPNIKLKNSDIIKIFDKLDAEIFEHIHFRGNSILNFAITYRNLDLIKYFVEKKKLALDIGDNVNTMHPFTTAYRLTKEEVQKPESNKILKYIWDQIKKDVKWEETDFNGENIAFRLLDIKAEYNETDKSPSKLELDVLKRNEVWNKLNVEKFSILSMLINFNFKKYHKVLNGKNIDFTIKNGYGQNIIDESEESGEAGWYEYFKKKKSKQKSIKCDDVKVKNYTYSDHNLFQADFAPVSLGFIYLDEKIKNLYLPKNIKSSNHIPTFSTMFTGIFGDRIEQYNNFPFIILYKDEKNYFIHPMLNVLMKNASNENKYDFGVVFVSLDLTNQHENLLHANMIIYNFKNKTIEYFEPYGNHDSDASLHKILKEELCWNTGFSYLEPKDYLPVASFQFLAFENNEYEQKPGDFGGYCMAWCFWYLEHRILNPSINPRRLVQKLIDKILRGKYNLVEYIRNYANSLYKNQIAILKKIGIKKERITNLKRKNNEIDKIFNYIIKKTSIGHQ